MRLFSCVAHVLRALRHTRVTWYITQLARRSVPRRPGLYNAHFREVKGSKNIDFILNIWQNSCMKKTEQEHNFWFYLRWMLLPLLNLLIVSGVVTIFLYFYAFFAPLVTWIPVCTDDAQCAVAYVGYLIFLAILISFIPMFFIARWVAPKYKKQMGILSILGIIGIIFLLFIIVSLL